MSDGPRYQVRTDRFSVPHGCCWDAVVIDTEDAGQGIVCECDADDAQVIADAMNARAMA